MTDRSDYIPQESVDDRISSPLKARTGGGPLARLARIVVRSGRSEIRTLDEPTTAELPFAPGPRRGKNIYLWSFVGFVVIPTFACIVYFAFLASDQYVAEARFAVQATQFGFASGSGSNSSKTSSSSSTSSIPTLATQDAYVITNYIRSRAIIDDLRNTVDIPAIYRRPEADFWARLKKDAKAEEIEAYWKGMVGTYIDGPSGIVTLTVRTFRPEDSRNLAQAVLAASEKLANRVSARARASVMEQAEAEVRRSEGLVRDALADMRAFRDKQGFIDPIASATSTSTLLLQAMSQKIGLENNYFVGLKSMSPDAPSIVNLKLRLDEMNRQIDSLKAQLTGDSAQGKTIAAALTTFESLELKRVFAEKLYTMSQDALERARLKAEQQNIYISTFVAPATPEYSEYPARLELSILAPIALGIIWGLFALIAAAVEDHRF